MRLMYLENSPGVNHKGEFYPAKDGLVLVPEEMVDTLRWHGYAFPEEMAQKEKEEGQTLDLGEVVRALGLPLHDPSLTLEEFVELVSAAIDDLRERLTESEFLNSISKNSKGK